MSEGGRWRAFVSGRSGRLLTIGLVTLQVGGCAADLMSEQATAISFFCLVAADASLLGAAATGIWLVLAFSWILGLVAIRTAGLRPLYWALVLLIPAALAGQGALIERQALRCDGP